jgi:hypothetical protein
MPERAAAMRKLSKVAPLRASPPALCGWYSRCESPHYAQFQECGLFYICPINHPFRKRRSGISMERIKDEIIRSVPGYPARSNENWVSRSDCVLARPAQCVLLHGEQIYSKKHGRNAAQFRWRSLIPLACRVSRSTPPLAT